MKTTNHNVRRYGMVIGLRPDKVKRYKKLHAAVWPGVLKMIKACHIRNYSIYLHRTGRNAYCLFSFFEYTGRNFKADMAKMAADPLTQEWWSHCEPCQKPVRYRARHEWWATLPEVFHLD
jgi:L-rhamnose mutarotase